MGTLLQAPSSSELFSASHGQFAYEPIRHTVAMLSVPKCGTLMVRNILAHFVPIEQIHFPFLDSARVVDPSHPLYRPEPRFFTGHVAYGVATEVAMRRARVVALVRDPVDFVLSQAHFLLTEERRAGGDPLPQALHDHGFTHTEIIPLVIGGTFVEGKSYGGVVEEFRTRALSWIARGARLVRYEDVKRHARDLDSPESEAYFRSLIETLGIPLPVDWAERVRAGISREISSTASEALTTGREGVARQAALTPDQFRMLEASAPGLREALGYTEPPRLI